MYICKRLTLKKYATSSIAHITIYNKHKHNHHYSHDASSSLKLSQSMPKLISASGSYWYGHIPVAISNFFHKFIWRASLCQNWYPHLARSGMAIFQLPFPTFFANLFGVLCTETVEATMPMAVESCRDIMISI